MDEAEGVGGDALVFGGPGQDGDEVPGATSPWVRAISMALLTCRAMSNGPGSGIGVAPHDKVSCRSVRGSVEKPRIGERGR